VADPRTFSQRLDRIAANVPKRSDEIVRRASLAASAAVITATPVDTGRARSNWQVGLNEPITNVRETMGVSPQPAIEEARQRVRTYDGTLHRAIFLTNNLPYIQRLNEGYSAQAPAGFVQAAIKMAVKQVKGARLLGY
jgi:hypothetical protein